MYLRWSTDDEVDYTLKQSNGSVGSTPVGKGFGIELLSAVRGVVLSVKTAIKTFQSAAFLAI